MAATGAYDNPPWYHPRITRIIAEERLRACATTSLSDIPFEKYALATNAEFVTCFLVRKSESTSGFAISFTQLPCNVTPETPPLSVRHYAVDVMDIITEDEYGAEQMEGQV